MRDLVSLVVGILILGWSGLGWAQEAPPPLRQVHSWMYWLDSADPALVSSSGFDLAVVDYSRDGTEGGAFSPGEVAAMQRGEGDDRRIVLSYLSIGEAEDYRFYWNPTWVRDPPSWLDEENPDWAGNFKVRYWEEAWQRIILGSPESYLDRILQAGFDGVYLDIIDAFEHYEDTRPGAAREMIRFVGQISEYGKSRRGGRPFYVFAQNGERLLEFPEFLEAIDGVAKEDLYWGYDGQEAFTPTNETEYSEHFLLLARDAGKKILTVDYVPGTDQAREVYARSRVQDFIPYATHRDLDRYTVNPGLDPESSGPPPEAEVQRWLPGQFFALTAPRGVFRVSLGSDSWSETFSYSPEDFGVEGDATPLEAQSFSEWTHALSVGYGLTDRWEVGVRIPLVQTRFEPDDGDAVSEVGTSHSENGLGNVNVVVANSRSWLDGDQNLLMTLELGLPTDTRVSPFGAESLEARFSVTGERYWDRVGIIGTAAATYYGADDPGEGETVLEGFAGVGAQMAESFYAAGYLGMEGGNVRVEVGAEFLLTSTLSLEAFFGRDLSGEAEATFFGAALNLWRR